MSWIRIILTFRDWYLKKQIMNMIQEKNVKARWPNSDDLHISGSDDDQRDIDDEK